MSLSSWQIIPIAIAISLTGFLISPEGQTRPPILLSQGIPPEPPQNPPPPGNNTPGGDLGDADRCETNGRQLSAIAFNESEPNTSTSAEPVLWVYVPYSSEEATFGELRLLDRKQTRYIQETSFALPQTPGFVSISLREASEEALIEGEYYRWNLTVNCRRKLDSEDDPRDDVSGWVRLVPDSSGTVASGWYDRVNDVATRLAEPPEEQSALKKEWTELLESLGFGDLAEEPIIGPVEIIERRGSEGD